MSEITKFESAPIANISDFVQIKDEQVYTTSRIVAEKFGKEHFHVTRDIEELIKNMVQPIENIRKTKIGFSENKVQPNFGVSENIENIREVNFDFSEYFIPDEYKIEGQTRTYKQYLITEKGAMLLIMGFTGEKAFAIKTKFIDEFARMKNIINNPAQVIAETGSLDALVAFGVTNQRFTNALVKAKQEQQLLEQQKNALQIQFNDQNDTLRTKVLPAIVELKSTVRDQSNRITNLEIERNDAVEDYEGLYNHYINSDGWFKMSEVAGKLNIHGMGRNKIFSILRERHILDRRNLPYRQFIESGMFMIKDTDIMVGDRIKTVSTTFVSKKGQVFIEKLLRKLGYC